MRVSLVLLTCGVLSCPVLSCHVMSCHEFRDIAIMLPAVVDYVPSFGTCRHNISLLPSSPFFFLLSSLTQHTFAQTGTTHECWYDSEDFSEIQWNKPNPQTGKIMLAVGFAVAGAALLAFSTFCQRSSAVVVCDVCVCVR